MFYSLIVNTFENKLIQLMTNINKFKELYDMQSHKAEEVALLFKDFLPHGYSQDVVNLANEKEIEVSSGVVRSVKAGLVKNIKVLTVLVEYAKEKKEAAKKEREQLNNLLSK